MHAYTLYSSFRPFGVTAMLGSWTQVSRHNYYQSSIIVFTRREEQNCTVLTPVVSAMVTGAVLLARPRVTPRLSWRS